MHPRSLRPLHLSVPLLLLAGCGAGSAGIISATGDDSGTANSATVLSGLEITDREPEDRAWRSPARVAFTLTDQEGDRANVSLTFSTDGGATFQPVATEPGTQLSNLEPGDYAVNWQYANATDLGDTSYRPGIILRAAVSGGDPRTVTADMGNDPPAIDPSGFSLVGEGPDYGGIVQMGFEVSDSSADQVDIRVEFNQDAAGGYPDSAWQLARSVGVDANTGTPDFALNNLDTVLGQTKRYDLFWQSDFVPPSGLTGSEQMASLESDVKLRFTAVDEFNLEGDSVETAEFRIDNNRPPLALLDEGAFLLGVKDRGNIPLSLTVLDDESDEVQIAIQWKTGAGSFPLVRNGAGQEVELGSLNPEELRDLLENPARKRDRLDAQIAQEAPTIYEGRFGTLASGLAANQARLPELASSQAGLLAQGIVGRELEVVRPDRLEALEVGLAGACGAYVTEEGQSALVLHDVGGSTWRISEVDLADGTLLSTVGSGAGTPRSLTVDPLGETLFVGTDQNVFRVERFTGVVSAPLAHGMTDGPRALAALGDDVVLATGDDELRRLSIGGGSTTSNAVLMSGLAQPWGVVRDPLRASGIYLAESTASTGGAAPGRVVSVDLDRLVLEDLAAEVAPEDQGTLGSVPFPNAKALALEADGSRLLAVTSVAGRNELRSLMLRSPIDLSEPADEVADPVVREEDLVADANGSVATGRLGIRVVAPWTGTSVGVSGGAVQVRSIESYDSTEQVVTLDSALDPALGAGGDVRWRVQTRAENVSSSPQGRSATFLWDTSVLPDPSVTGLRLLSADADLGMGGASALKPYRSELERVEASLQTGTEPVSVATADLDGDGDLDLVSANGGANNLTLYFQTSAGTFTSADDPLPTGNVPLSVAAADLDGDGDMDLVSANIGSNNLTLYFQTSPGTFTEREDVPLPVGSRPSFVAAADLDGDGDMDLVSANSKGNNLTLLRQTQAGTFDSTGAPLPTGAGPVSVAVADLDGDGDMDLVSANSVSNSLDLYFQRSAGIFNRSEFPLGTGRSPSSVAAADLDGDGDMDLVSANFDDDDLTIFFQSLGFFFPATAPLTAGDGPESVAAADLDGDGDMDLVSANFESDDLTLFFQTSTGTFTPSAAPILAGVGPRSVAAADLNGDGDMDLVSANINGDDLTLFFQTSEGVFTPAAAPLPAGDFPRSVAAADLDGDGDLDLVSANDGGNNLTLYFQTSPGTFTPAAAPLPTGNQPASVVAADLDGDGDMDLVSANRTSRNLTLYFQTSAGTFTGREDIPLPVGARPVSVAAADLDGDGDMDLVSVNADSDSLTVLFQTSPGTFTPAAAPLPVGAGPVSVAAADLDGDGDMDLVSANGDSLTVLFQTSPGTFTPATAPLSAGNSPFSVVAADLDGDGDMDLVSANSFSDDLTLFFQTSPGTFTPAAAPLPVGDFPLSVAAADLDGDGDMDLVSANEDGNNLTLLLQTSAGTFTPAAAPLPAGGAPRGVIATDLDGDGDMDLVSANGGTDDLTILFNGN